MRKHVWIYGLHMENEKIDRGGYSYREKLLHFIWSVLSLSTYMCIIETVKSKNDDFSICTSRIDYDFLSSIVHTYFNMNI